MKRIFYITLFILLIDLTFQDCANVGRPTGGPKDTIPPLLIYASPENGTTNFDDTEIELHFQEFINADKIQQQLIVTPNVDPKYKHIVKRNRLIIKLEEPLPDATTFNFNFADAVTDITEKNPAVNLSLAFSTGNYIDSMSVVGSVEDLFTKEPGTGYLVGLYPFTDTLDFFTEKPTYFTTADEDGFFEINYIKTGIYKILSFFDDNRNLLLDPDLEAHGFFEEIVSLDSQIIFEEPIRTVLQNVKPITLINARPTGLHVEVKYNKMIDSYELLPSYLNHSITGEKREVIRIYKPDSINYNDSIQAYVKAYDSLNNLAEDTIKFVFLESNRKPADLSFSLIPNQLIIQKSQNFEANFNKPILSYDSSKLLFKADSIFSEPAEHQITWNHNLTKANFIVDINIDSLKQQVINSLPTDTARTDSTIEVNQKPDRKITLTFEKGAFISVENDTTGLSEISIIEPPKRSEGTLNLELDTEETSFTLQLLDKDQVKYSIQNQTKISMDIQAGSYMIRILIDSNQDGEWSAGNLLKNQEPEKIFIYEEEIAVRENWVIDLGITF